MLTRRDFENHDAIVLVLKDDEDRFLCLFHRKFDFWTLPLGKAEVGQTPEEAAIAEAQEEIGILVTRLIKRYQGTKIYCRDGRRIMTFFHVFEILEYEGEVRNREPIKHPSLKFMTIEKIRNLSRTSDGTVLFLSYLDHAAHAEVRNERADLAKSVRIGLSGASGAGKTTLSRRLHEQFGLSVHPETVRNWLVEKGNLQYSALTPALRVELQLYLLGQYESSSANVFDRCALDCLYYSSVIPSLAASDDFRARAVKLLSALDVIIFFPAHSLFLLDDGVRIANFKHQTEVASRMLIQAYEAGIKDKILIYDHCRTLDENICELVTFLSAAGSFKN